MTREIKFRAWDKETKAMSKPFTLEDIADEFDCGYSVNIDLPDTYDGGWNDIVFMQFTGLHDKNGKEIYEGDIVDFPTSIMGGPPYLVKTINIFEMGSPASYPGIEYGKVIGNIHENADLIKG